MILPGRRLSPNVDGRLVLAIREELKEHKGAATAARAEGT